MRRAATPEELIRRASRAIQAIDEAIARIDGGDRSSYDGLIQALRLLACHGAGNRLLIRLAQATGESLTTASITAPPQPAASARELLTFALGGVPLEDIPRGKLSSPVLRVSFEELMATRCLLLKGSWADKSSGVDESFTWDTLVSAVANKLGPSHADDQVPIVFDELCRYSVNDGGTNPAAWAIRTLGVTVRRCGAELLASLGETLDLRPAPSVCAGPWGLWFGELRIHGRIGGMVEVGVTFVTKGGPPQEEIKVHWRSQGEPWL